VVPDDIFITVGIAGGFTETLPVPLTETEILEIARAGADGLHTNCYRKKNNQIRI